MASHRVIGKDRPAAPRLCSCDDQQRVVILAEGLARSFDGGRVPAVKDVSLTMRSGESIAIMGQSGSGKSTLLNLLCGLDRPDRGRVLIDGHEPGSRAAWSEVRARRIGMVFQGFNLLPALTACENVEIPMFGVRAGAKARRQRALTLLSEVGLAGREHHRPAELSGGERQRVAMARSLANDPAVLLADEPTGSLDSTTAQAVLELLLGLHRMDAMALLIVTHDRDVAAVTDRQLTMKDGRLA
jgi:ABC-type lipoprotein export system ATPase subunit